MIQMGMDHLGRDNKKRTLLETKEDPYIFQKLPNLRGCDDTDSHSSMCKFLGLILRVFILSGKRQLSPLSFPKCLWIFKTQPLLWATMRRKRTEESN